MTTEATIKKKTPKEFYYEVKSDNDCRLGHRASLIRRNKKQKKINEKPDTLFFLFSFFFVHFRWFILHFNERKVSRCWIWIIRWKVLTFTFLLLRLFFRRWNGKVDRCGRWWWPSHHDNRNEVIWYRFFLLIVYNNEIAPIKVVQIAIKSGRIEQKNFMGRAKTTKIDICVPITRNIDF